MKIVDSIKTRDYTSFKPDDNNKYIQVFVNITNNRKNPTHFFHHLV